MLTMNARNHPEEEKVKVKNPVLKIETWNAKSLLATGKGHNIIAEMKRMSINILGVREVRWSRTGQVNIDGQTMYYTGNDDSHHHNGVALIVNDKTNRSIKNFVPLSDRIALLQIKAVPKDINFTLSIIVIGQNVWKQYIFSSQRRVGDLATI